MRLLLITMLMGMIQFVVAQTDIDANGQYGAEIGLNNEADTYKQYVDLTSGRAVFPANLGSVQGGSLSFNVGFNYMGGGVKVDQRSSNIGLGWEPNYMFSVSRVVIGMADETYGWNEPSYGGTWSTVNYELDFSSTDEEIEYDLEMPHPQALLASDEALRWAARGKLDLQPDEFKYNIPGHNGTFVFDFERFGDFNDGLETLMFNGVEYYHVPFLTVPYDEVQIWTRWVQGIYGNELASFLIIDPFSGVKYLFNDVVYSANIGGPYNRDRLFLGRLHQADEFYLSEVYDAKNELEFQFNYDKSNDPEILWGADPALVLIWDNGVTYEANGTAVQSPIGIVNSSEVFVSNSENHCWQHDYGPNPSSCSTSGEDFFKNITTVARNHIRLTNIWSKYNLVEFSYWTPRQDMQGDFELNRVTFKNAQNEQLGQFNLKHRYTSGGDLEYRLILSGLEKISNSGGTLPILNFDYFEDVLLPSYSSYSVDFFGFYNGQANTNLIPESGLETGIPNLTFADRDPYFQYTKSQHLRKVYFPNGGFLEFELEPNSYGIINGEYCEEVITGGVRVGQIVLKAKSDDLVVPTVFDYTLSGDDDHSSGNQVMIPQFVIQGKPQLSGLDISGIYRFISGCDYDICTRHCSAPQYSSSFANGSLFQYDNVLVRRPGLGYTEYAFSNVQIDPSSYAFPYAVMDTKNNQRGNLLRTTIINELGAKISEETNDWGLTYSDDQLCMGVRIQQFSTSTAHCKEYYYNSSIYSRLQTIKTTYAPNDPLNYQVSSTLYNYHPDFHDVIESVVQVTSDPENPYTVFRNKILGDYVAYSAADAMNEAVIFSGLNNGIGRKNVVETITLKGSSMESLRVYAGNLKTFRVEDGRLVMDVAYGLDLELPVEFNELFWSRLGEEGFVMNEGYNEERQVLLYAEDYRPVSVKHKELLITTSLYNGTTRNVAAEVVNARINEVAYSSFEGQCENGWTYSLEGCVSNLTSVKGLTLPDAASGGRCYNFGTSGPITSQELNEGSYKLTFWTKQNSIVDIDLSNGELTAIYEAQQNEHFGWLYNEYLIQSSEPFSVTIDGNLNQKLDELRLYPDQAVVKSKTYNSNGTINSVCDPGSHFTYFVYDDWNRIVWVINDQGELTSYTDYHDKNPDDNNDHAWVSTCNIVDSNISSEELINGNYNIGEVNVIKRYFDGLGRLIQLSDIGGSNVPSRDINEITVFDEYGRVTRSYLPYSSTINADGVLDVSPIESVLNFYSATEYVAQTDYPFADVEFTSDVTQQVKERGNVGEAWQLGNGHSQQFDWSYITTSQDVLLWKGSSSEFKAMEGGQAVYYPEGALVEKVTTNEQGSEIIEYYDLFGNRICSRRQVWISESAGFNITEYTGSGGFEDNLMPYEAGDAELRNYDTYYIYDDFGRLIYQLPPNFTSQLNGVYGVETNVGGLNFEAFDGLVEAYRYDVLGRLIELKGAGTPWNEFVYDKLDRVVLARNTGDESGNWSYTKYDHLNRIIQTGIHTNIAGRSQLQALVDSDVNPLWETWTHGADAGYSNVVYPTSSIELMTEFYYDDYSFDSEGLSYEVIEQPLSSYSFRTLGMMTGQKVRVLNETGDFLISAFYFNSFVMPLVSVESTLHGGIVKHHFNYDSKKNLESTTTFLQYSNDADILKVSDYYEYDHKGRSEKVSRKINDNEIVILSEFEYNRLGQLIRKRLHRTNDTQLSMQVVDYRYNERGWLRKINNADLVDDGDNLESYDVFGEEIFYNSTAAYNSSTLSLNPRFDGNIAGIKWKSKTSPDDYGSMMSGHSYVYRYDDLGQLTAAFYAASHDLAFDDYSYKTHFWDEKVKYDLNGNIRNIYRNRGKTENGTVPNSPICVDDLTFKYYPFANRLEKISDNAISNWINAEAASPFHHFIDGANDEQEYFYNAKGELIQDENKGMSFAYNHLGLIRSIHNGIEEISTTWDAKGNKLSSISSEGSVDYLGGAEFKNGVILNVKHLEGLSRCIDSSNDLWVSDYYILDHLGNVRAVITSEESEIIRDVATVELDLRPVEEDLFDNLETEKLKPYLYPFDPKYPNNQLVSELTSLSNKVIGPARLTKVKAGELVDIEVSHWYNELSGSPLQDMSSILAGVLTNLAIQGVGILPVGPESGLALINNVSTPQFQSLQDFVYGSLDDRDLTKPAGYLAYMFFDLNMNIDPKYSGVLPIGEGDELVRLSRNGVKIPKEGYLYVYVTNVSEQRVYFDNLSLKRWAPVVRQTYDYYPFGLLWENPSSAFQDPEHHDDCYQSKEYIWKCFEGGKDPNLYDFHARLFDPAIGRWLTPDPAMQHFSPYLAMSNNPVSMVDPTGLLDGWIEGEDGQYYYYPEINSQLDYTLYKIGVLDIPDDGVIENSKGYMFEDGIAFIEGEPVLLNNDGTMSQYEYPEVTIWDSKMNSDIVNRDNNPDVYQYYNKYGGIEEYREWQANPFYNEGEDKWDRIFRGIGNAHLEIMYDWGGGGYIRLPSASRVTKVGVDAAKGVTPSLGSIKNISGSLDDAATLARNQPYGPNINVFRRLPRNAQDAQALAEAQMGMGRNLNIKLKDPRYQGWEKWHRSVGPKGSKSVVHYLRNPETGFLTDFKFK